MADRSTSHRPSSILVARQDAHASPSAPGIDQLDDELLIDGFVVLEDLIPIETWNSKVLNGEPSTGQGRVTQKQRFKIVPPFEMPFCDPVITENPLVLELL